MILLFKYKSLCVAALAALSFSLSPIALHAQSLRGETNTFAWLLEPAYRHRSDGKPGRSIRLALKDTAYVGSILVKVTCNSMTEITQLNNSDSLKNFRLLLPEGAGVDSATTAEITVVAGDKKSSVIIPVQKRKQWTVY